MRKVALFVDSTDLYNSNKCHKERRFDLSLVYKFASRHYGQVEKAVLFFALKKDFDTDPADFLLKAKEVGYRYEVTETSKDFLSDSHQTKIAMEAMAAFQGGIRDFVFCTNSIEMLPVFQFLKSQGARVELIYNYADMRLKNAVDLSVSCYLLPGVTPFNIERFNLESGDDLGELTEFTEEDFSDDLLYNGWGTQWARGYCYWLDRERGFGYFRYFKPDYLSSLSSLSLWHSLDIEDTGIMGTSFFNIGQFVDETGDKRLLDLIPSIHTIFQFTLEESEEEDGGNVSSLISLVDRG